MNTNLQYAKRAKNDEFYTQYCDIEKELQNYDVSIFKDKVVYLPADVAQFDGTIPQSEFVRYFLNNAERLGFKRLIATCLEKFTPNGLNGYEYNNTDDSNFRERYFNCPPDPNGKYGSGDFRSKECTEILKKSDIVVTNPPFSLFREFIAWLIKYDKKFITVSNKNAISYKEFYPLIRDDKVWVGATSLNGGRWMIMPPEVDVESKSVKVDEKGNKLLNVAGVCWFTNLPIKKRTEDLLLTENYYENDGVTPLPDSEIRYPHYDNYDAINVDKVTAIPQDYYGVMGVPITFLDKYSPEQFEIVAFRKGEDGKDLVFTRAEEREFNRTFVSLYDVDCRDDKERRRRDQWKEYLRTHNDTSEVEPIDYFFPVWQNPAGQIGDSVCGVNKYKRILIRKV